MFNSKTLYNLKKVFNYLPHKRRKDLLSLIPLSFFAGISEVIVLGLLARLLNFIVGQPRAPIPIFSNLFNFDPKYKIIILISVFVLTNWISSIVKLYLRAKQLKIKATIWRDLSELAHKNLLEQPYEFFLKNNNSDLSASVLVNITQVCDWVILPLLRSISGIVVMISVSIAVLSIAKVTALLLIIGLLLGYLTISLAIIPRIRLANKKRSELKIKTNNILNESLNSIIDIKLTNSESYFQNKYIKTGRDFIPIIWRGDTLPEIPRALVEPFGITLIFFIGIITPLLTNSDFDEIIKVIPFLATITAAALKLTPPLQDTFKGYNSIRGGLPDLSEALKIIDLKISKKIKNNSANNQATNIKKFIYPIKTITLENIVFKYPNSNSNVIDGLNLEIEIGKRIAFVGSTGSGKTTTANILLQLLKQQQGNLSLDGKPLAKEHINKWQFNCAYVPQTFYLNNSTILENIAFAKRKREINIKEVMKALDKAKLKDLIDNLPNGLETFIGENGIMLSGGQRQRLALARAFYRKSRFLVLDEATSALDNQTESKIMSSIDLMSNNCTLIIIAHRLSTVVNADKIYEFESGKIIHSGTFDELCKKSKSFKDLNLLEKKILRG